MSGLYEGLCICWFSDKKVIGLLSPYSITVVYMPGTSIVFSVSAVSSSCLRTKEQGAVGEQGENYVALMAPYFKGKIYK